jgi:hypothetical protein
MLELVIENKFNLQHPVSNIVKKLIVESYI